MAERRITTDDVKVMVDGAAEILRLRSDLKAAQARISRLQLQADDLHVARIEAEDEASAHRARIAELGDLPLCRRQLPDGSVPSGTKAALVAWVAVADEQRTRIAELERELAEAQDRHAATERDACMWAERHEAAQARIAELEREREEALQLTESCSSLKDMAAAGIEGAARIAELEQKLFEARLAVGPVCRKCEIERDLGYCRCDIAANE